MCCFNTEKSSGSLLLLIALIVVNYFSFKNLGICAKGGQRGMRLVVVLILWNKGECKYTHQLFRLGWSVGVPSSVSKYKRRLH